jgi:hypothetical protein
VRKKSVSLTIEARTVRRCLNCERPLGWFAKFLYDRYCSSRCKARYRETITTLALERLNARPLLALPPPDPGPKTLVLAPKPESQLS